MSKLKEKFKKLKENPDVALKDQVGYISGIFGNCMGQDSVGTYTDQFMYDYMGALRVQDAGTYLPDVEKTLKSKSGICFDFAAIVCCMLRTQGIPTKLVIGYADRAYHAWNQVYIDGSWQLIDTTARITGTKVGRYTPERWY